MASMKRIAASSGFIVPAALIAALLLLHAPICAIEAHGGSTESGHDASSRSLVLVKIYCLILIFFAAFLGGVSPCFVKWNDGLLVLGTQFGGGVFLGTALIHFLNDANETFRAKLPDDNQYPFAFMLACAGYLLTMLADCVVQHVYSKHSAAKSGAESGAKSAFDSVDSAAKSAFDSVHSAAKSASDSAPARVVDVQLLGHHAPQLRDEVDGEAPAMGNIKRSASDTILLILALCFHSIFEGMAIGVAENEADAWRALWTISLHKVFAAIAMGIALLRLLPARPLRQCVIYSFLFGISSPIGVGIGLAINTTTEAGIADWVYAISMGIACGVFIYVSIHHLLIKGYSPAHRVRADTPFFRFVAASLGAATLAIVMIWD